MAAIARKKWDTFWVKSDILIQESWDLVSKDKLWEGIKQLDRARCPKAGESPKVSEHFSEKKGSKLVKNCLHLLTGKCMCRREWVQLNVSLRDQSSLRVTFPMMRGHWGRGSPDTSQRREMNQREVARPLWWRQALHTSWTSLPQRAEGWHGC